MLNMTHPFSNLHDARPIVSVALLVLLLAWESWKPFYSFPKGRERLGHGLRNFLLGVVNGLMGTLVFVGLWWLAADWSARHGFGLLHRLALPPVVEWVLAVLLLDVWTYLWHRMNHRIPFLWRFHRVHHSDPHMDVTTANRFHIGEIFMSSVLRVPLIVLLGVGIDQLALYELLMFAVVQFHHANISITEKWDRLLRCFIVTPFMHKVHHSRWQPETDSNYSSLLSVWDRVFRSFRHHENPATIRIGLDEYDLPDRQSLPGMLKTPWLKRKPPTPDESS